MQTTAIDNTITTLTAEIQRMRKQLYRVAQAYGYYGTDVRDLEQAVTEMEIARDELRKARRVIKRLKKGF